LQHGVSERRFLMLEDLKLEVETILEMEIEFLKESKVPSTSAFFITPKKLYLVDPFDFSDKPKAKKLLKKLAKKHKAIMVITIMDALITKMTGSISIHPYFYKKVIFAYGETKYDSFGIAQEFENDKNGQIVLGNRIFFPVGMGSMTGFMRRKF
jgi:hypothetical protein